MKEIITVALGFLKNVTETNDEREKRRNLTAFKKHRRKIRRDFKKDGFTDQEKALLAELDNAYVELLLSLGKF